MFILLNLETENMTMIRNSCVLYIVTQEVLAFKFRSFSKFRILYPELTSLTVTPPPLSWFWMR